MDKYIQLLDKKDIIGKKIRKDGINYTIVACKICEGSLYLAFVSNISKKVKEYGKELIEEEIKELNTINLACYDDERSDGTLLFPHILQVKNTKLLRPKFIRFIGGWDYESKTDWVNLFQYNCGDRQSLDEFDFINYPFIKNGKPVTSFEKIDFSTEENQLRQIFINAMDPLVASQYIKEFKEECLRTINTLNEEYVTYRKEQMLELKKQYNKANNEYVKAIEGKAKANEEQIRYQDSLIK